LLIIDPQNDFILETGTLSVPGAVEDSLRLSAAIERNLGEIDNIFVTMDTHAKFHIAHADFWSGPNGEKPAPFTEITVDDVKQGKWKAANPEFAKHVLDYVCELAVENRFTLMVWPDHCLVGGSGHAVHEPLFQQLLKWESFAKRPVNYLLKGNNSKTEMYSAFKAEIPLLKDPSTKMNYAFVNELLKYNKVIVAGQASSHCVNYSVRDLASMYPQHRRSQIYIARDAMSAVQGAEEAEKTFYTDMQEVGVTIGTIADAFVASKKA